MVSFYGDIKKSTEEFDPDQLQAKQDVQQRRLDVMQKQFGGQQTAGTPQLGIGTRAGYDSAMAASKVADFDRRKQAASNVAGLAESTDKRNTALSDQIQAAIRNRKLAQQKLQDTQYQQNRTQDLALREIGAGSKIEMGKMNFTQYQNDQERKEAMRSLQAKGALDQQMLNAAINGDLRMADIDAFFAMQDAELEAAFKARLKEGQFGLEQWEATIKASAQNWGAIISGGTTMGEGGMEAYGNYKDTGNVWGVKQPAANTTTTPVQPTTFSKDWRSYPQAKDPAYPANQY